MANVETGINGNLEAAGWNNFNIVENKPLPHPDIADLYVCNLGVTTPAGQMKRSQEVGKSPETAFHLALREIVVGDYPSLEEVRLLGHESEIQTRDSNEAVAQLTLQIGGDSLIEVKKKAKTPYNAFCEALVTGYNEALRK